MKHSLNIILVLIAFYTLSQLTGLLVTQAYIETTDTDTKEIVWKKLPSLAGMPFERPEMAPDIVPIYILIGIAIGTIIIWLFTKVQYLFLWRIWFIMAITLCLYVSFYTFLNSKIALLLSLILSTLKIFRPSIIIHNLTEIFIYGGLSAIFVPILSINSTIILLIMISIYDIYAVWKSKHMIKLAKFQMKAKLFAGLLIPYRITPLMKQRARQEKKIRTAILGGGDIAFPLLFAGVIMTTYGILPAFIISICSAAALFLLIYYGNKDRFYPAMPFLSAGCFIGYGIILLITLF